MKPTRPLPPVERPTTVGPVGAAAGLGGLHVGVAQVDLTPALRLGRTGYGPDEPPAYGALGRLRATVIVVDDGKAERVAIVAADLHAGFRWVAEHLGVRCAPLGLTVDRIFLAASHTHCGPGPFYGHATYDRIAGTAWLDDWSDHFDVTSATALVDRLAGAIADAVRELAPGKLGYGVAPVWGISWNRSADAVFWLPVGAPTDPDSVPPRFVDRDEAGYRALSERINRGVTVPDPRPVPPSQDEGLEGAPAELDPAEASRVEFALDVMDLAEDPKDTLDEALRRLVRKRRAFLPLALPDLLKHAARIDLKKFPPTPHRKLSEERAWDRQIVDARVHALRVESAAGAGAIVFFGATSTLLGAEHPLYCGDTYAEAARRVERTLGGRVGFAGGALGDVNLVSPARPVADVVRTAARLEGAVAMIDEAAGPLADAAGRAIAAARDASWTELTLTASFREVRPGGRIGFPDDAPPTHRLAERGTFTAGPSVLAASELAGGQAILEKLGFTEGRSKITRDAYDADDPAWPKLVLPPMEHPPTELPFRALKIAPGQAKKRKLVLLGMPGEVSTVLATQIAEEIGGDVIVASLVGDFAGYLGTVWEYLAQHYEGASTLYGRWTGEWAVRQAALTVRTPSQRASGTVRFSGGTCERPRFDDPTRGFLQHAPRVPEPTLKELGRKKERRLITRIGGSGVELWACWPVKDDDRARPLWFGPRVALEQRSGGGAWTPVRDAHDGAERFLVWREDDGKRSVWLFHARIRGAAVAPGAELSLRIRRDLRLAEEDRLVASAEEGVEAAEAAPRTITVTVPITFTIPAAPRADEGLEAPAAPVDPWVRAHAVAFGASGRLASGGRLATTVADLDALAARIQGQHKVVLHFHGGLVGEKAAVGIAADLGRWLEANTDAWPLFVAWKTGPIEVLPATLADVLRKPRVVVRIFAWVLRALGFDPMAAMTEGLEAVVVPDPYAVELEGRPRAEPPTVDELAGEMRADAELQAAIEALRAPEGLEAVAEPLLDPRFVGEIAPPADGLEVIEIAAVFRAARIAVRIAGRVLERRGGPAWNGWHDTIVEEVVREVGPVEVIGPAAWNRMKENAREAYLDGRGGALLADRLAEFVRGGGELHVVAHSAGSFHAGYLLRALTERVPTGTLFRSLSLLAPACDMAFLADTFVALQNRLEGRRMFVLTEQQEDREQMIPVLYRGSLLNLISGFLEERPGWPVLGMARFLDVETDRDSVIPVVRAPSATSAAPPDTSHALRHGAFDNDTPTRHSIARLIR